ncbi:glycosyltransferase [Agrococcus sp. 1P02AA]|uniref:CgeB family protein n=1 Tax=Agrococcus sp. 1P02AA TaxID=3132259 RepID=UPI0039A70B19
MIEPTTPLAALHLPPSAAPEPGRGRLRAVSVLDRFSHSSFSDALELWPIEPSNVATDLDLIAPDLLFVESAWSGNDGAWLHQLTGTSGPKPSVMRLIDEARDRGIPTVFWNKEDPPHFQDFLPLARTFDHVFTTEGRLVDEYLAAGAGSAEVLQFAASPTIHNPIAVDGMREGGVCFAGQYFRHKYPERRAQMDVLFSAAANFDFAIYSRMQGGDERYQFPDRYADRIRGSLPYEEMVREYKRHRVFLNVNSVEGSRTMCARRIFELAASKTVVVSPRSPAIAAVFAEDEVLLADTEDEVRDALELVLGDPLERRRIGQRAWRRVSRAHLYEHRVEQIAQRIGLDAARRRPSLSVVLTASDHDVSEALLTLRRQRVHDLIEGPLRVGVRARDGGDLRFDPAQWPELELSSHSPRVPLATTLVASMDAKHQYAPDYLSDLVMLLDRYPVGDVVTKASWRGLDAGTPEEQHVDEVRRGAWVARAGAATRLLELEQSAGAALSARAYAADPFSFIAADDDAPSAWEA